MEGPDVLTGLSFAQPLLNDILPEIVLNSAVFFIVGSAETDDTAALIILFDCKFCANKKFSKRPILPRVPSVISKSAFPFRFFIISTSVAPCNVTLALKLSLPDKAFLRPAAPAIACCASISEPENLTPIKPFAILYEISPLILPSKASPDRFCK